MIRCCTKQTLEWMPDAAKDYKNIILQLTINDKLTWQTVAKDIKFGTPIAWTAPEISSRFCRLRLVSIDADGQMTLLAQSGMFRTSTAAKPTRIGPEKVKEHEPF